MKAARKLASQYYLTYQDEIPPSQLVQRIAGVMQEYTQSGYVFQHCSVSSPRIAHTGERGNGAMTKTFHNSRMLSGYSSWFRIASSWVLALVVLNYYWSISHLTNQWLPA